MQENNEQVKRNKEESRKNIPGPRSRTPWAYRASFRPRMLPAHSCWAGPSSLPGSPRSSRTPAAPRFFELTARLGSAPSPRLRLAPVGWAVPPRLGLGRLIGPVTQAAPARIAAPARYFDARHTTPRGMDEVSSVGSDRGNSCSGGCCAPGSPQRPGWACVRCIGRIPRARARSRDRCIAPRDIEQVSAMRIFATPRTD